MDNVNQANQPHSNGARSQARHLTKKQENVRRLLLIVGAIVLVAFAAAGAWFLKSQTGVAATIDSSRYQAVFFTNGQVYFGKLKAVNGDYMRLTDIYYLQAKATADNKSNPQEASAQDASNVQLVKLGSEIHGPDDEMVVNRDQILFFENLKKDSNVSTTIASYKSQQKK